MPVRPWGLIEGHLPSSLAGLRVSKVLPDLDGTHLPPIRSFFGPLFRNSSTPLDLAPRAALSTEGVAPIEQSPQKIKGCGPGLTRSGVRPEKERRTIEGLLNRQMLINRAGSSKARFCQ